VSGVSTNGYISRDTSAPYITNLPEKLKLISMQQNTKQLNNIRMEMARIANG
jgi:hypothetical protein